MQNNNFQTASLKRPQARRANHEKCGALSVRRIACPVLDTGRYEGIRHAPDLLSIRPFYEAVMVVCWTIQ